MKVLKIIGKTIVGIISMVITLVLIVFITLNVGKYLIYNEYFSMRTDLCENPGLNDGFVCQGVAVIDDEEKVIVSGYMNDDSASRIYISDFDSNSYYVRLNKKNEIFTGHTGGVAVTGDTVYLASGSYVYTFSVDLLLNSKNGDVIEIGSGTKMAIKASCIYTDDNYLYIAEFHDGGKYNVTTHPFETKEGVHQAAMARYDINDLSKPNKLYSIRDRVQGALVTPDGKVIFSTSYGLTDTKYYVYNEGDAVKTTWPNNYDTSSIDLPQDVPVYLLEDCVRTVKGPAMGEDVDYYDGKVITLSEVASNKYIVGKFFFANKIVMLDFNK